MSQPWFEAVERGDLDAVGVLLGGIEVNGRDGRGRLPLTLAARHGHLEVARALLAAGADVNAGPAPRGSGPRLLMPAVASGSNADSFLGELFGGLAKAFGGKADGEEGPGIRIMTFDPSAMDEDGYDGPAVHEMTPLEAAVEGGHADMVRLLIRSGAKVRFSLMDEGNPLGRACQLGHAEIVETLLDAGAGVRGSFDDPPLLQAAGSGHAAIVRLLLDRGADPNELHEDGETALLTAAAGGHLDAVRLLVERGAKVDAKSEGENALYRAASNGHREVFDFLAPLSKDEELRAAAEEALEESRGRRPRNEDPRVESFIEAAMNGQLKKVEAAIAAGAIDVDAPGSHGNTALMYAAFYGHVPVIRALLAAGADPDASSTEDGLEAEATALMLTAGSAFINNHAEVIRLLAEAGADLDARDAEGRTALHHAAGRAVPNALQALLVLGADPNARDGEGHTALGLLGEVDPGAPAFYRKNTEMMIALLEGVGAGR